jgi:hypothetical protein
LSRALFTPFAIAIIAAAGACSLASKSGESGTHSSALQADDDPSGGSLSCGQPNVTMPADIPNASKCNSTTTTGCNGWTAVGDFQTGSAELFSVPNQGAQLFTIAPDATTLCLYLFRGKPDFSTGSLNGVHCYNTTTCDVCWWDESTGAGVRPTAGNLAHESADGSNCSDCHRNGPLLPKYDLWSDAKNTTRALAATCASNGGATWADPVSTWPLANPDGESVLPAPTGCGANNCHTSGFASGGSYCEFIGAAFADENGSMRGDGKSFKSQADCVNFRSSMGCDDSVLNCNDPEVAAQDADAGTADAGGDDGSMSSTGAPSGAACSQDADCASGTCTNGICADPSAGGSDAGNDAAADSDPAPSTPPGAAGDACSVGSDCTSNSCTDGVCDDGSGAAAGTACGADTDCASASCTSGVCDGAAAGSGCTTGGECASGTCTGGACADQPAAQ